MSKPLWIRGPAVCLLVTLIAMDAARTGWTMPTTESSGARFTPHRVPATAGKPGTFLPASIGHVESFHQGTNGKTLFYIEDAHSSLGAQENIARIIGQLVKKNQVKTVFEEGYEGPVPTEWFREAIPDVAKRKKAAWYLLDHLRLGGAEYAHITRESWIVDRGSRGNKKGKGKKGHGLEEKAELNHTDSQSGHRNLQSTIHDALSTNHDFKLIGADDEKLHQKNIQLYRKAAAASAQTAVDLRALKSELSRMALSGFSKPFKTWMGLNERFHAGSLDPAQYLIRSHDLLTASGKSLPENLFPQIYLLLTAVQAQKIPDIDARGLYQEIESLETWIAENLLDDANRPVWNYLKKIRLLEELNALTLSAPEFESLLTTTPTLGKNAGALTREIGDFIFSKTKRPMVLSSAWEQNMETAHEFYLTVEARDRVLTQRLKNFSTQKEEVNAALVFGGFHKRAILQMLEDQGWSYAVVEPRIHEISQRHENFYRELMTTGHLRDEIPLLPSNGVTQERLFNLAKNKSDLKRYLAANLPLPLKPTNLKSSFRDSSSLSLRGGRESSEAISNERSEVRTDANNANVDDPWKKLNQVGDKYARFIRLAAKKGQASAGTLYSLARTAGILKKEYHAIQDEQPDFNAASYAETIHAQMAKLENQSRELTRFIELRAEMPLAKFNLVLAAAVLFALATGLWSLAGGMLLLSIGIHAYFPISRNLKINRAYLPRFMLLKIVPDGALQSELVFLEPLARELSVSREDLQQKSTGNLRRTIHGVRWMEERLRGMDSDAEAEQVSAEQMSAIREMGLSLIHFRHTTEDVLRQRTRKLVLIAGITAAMLALNGLAQLLPMGSAFVGVVGVVLILRLFDIYERKLIDNSELPDLIQNALSAAKFSGRDVHDSGSRSEVRAKQNKGRFFQSPAANDLFKMGRMMVVGGLGGGLFFTLASTLLLFFDIAMPRREDGYLMARVMVAATLMIGLPLMILSIGLEALVRIWKALRALSAQRKFAWLEFPAMKHKVDEGGWHFWTDRPDSLGIEAELLQTLGAPYRELRVKITGTEIEQTVKVSADSEQILSIGLHRSELDGLQEDTSIQLKWSPQTMDLTPLKWMITRHPERLPQGASGVRVPLLIRVLAADPEEGKLYRDYFADQRLNMSDFLAWWIKMRFIQGRIEGLRQEWIGRDLLELEYDSGERVSLRSSAKDQGDLSIDWDLPGKAGMVHIEISNQEGMVHFWLVDGEGKQRARHADRLTMFVKHGEIQHLLRSIRFDRQAFHFELFTRQDDVRGLIAEDFKQEMESMEVRLDQRIRFRGWSPRSRSEVRALSPPMPQSIDRYLMQRVKIMKPKTLVKNVYRRASHRFIKTDHASFLFDVTNENSARVYIGYGPHGLILLPAELSREVVRWGRWVTSNKLIVQLIKTVGAWLLGFVTLRGPSPETISGWQSRLPVVRFEISEDDSGREARRLFFRGHFKIIAPAAGFFKRPAGRLAIKPPYAYEEHYAPMIENGLVSALEFEQGLYGDLIRSVKFLIDGGFPKETPLSLQEFAHITNIRTFFSKYLRTEADGISFETTLGEFIKIMPAELTELAPDARSEVRAGHAAEENAVESAALFLKQKKWKLPGDTLVYPAAGVDAKTVMAFVRARPEIKKVILIDPGYSDAKDGELYRQELLLRLMRSGADFSKQDIEKISSGDFDLVSRKMSSEFFIHPPFWKFWADTRAVKLEIAAQDYLKWNPHGTELPEGAALTVVKAPGDGGILSRPDLSGNVFYEKVFRDTAALGVIYEGRSFLPEPELSTDYRLELLSAGAEGAWLWQSFHRSEEEYRRMPADSYWLLRKNRFQSSHEFISNLSKLDYEGIEKKHFKRYLEEVVQVLNAGRRTFFQSFHTYYWLMDAAFAGVLLFFDVVHALIELAISTVPFFMKSVRRGVARAWEDYLFQIDAREFEHTRSHFVKEERIIRWLLSRVADAPEDLRHAAMRALLAAGTDSPALMAGLRLLRDELGAWTDARSLEILDLAQTEDAVRIRQELYQDYAVRETERAAVQRSEVRSGEKQKQPGSENQVETLSATVGTSYRLTFPAKAQQEWLVGRTSFYAEPLKDRPVLRLHLDPSKWESEVAQRLATMTDARMRRQFQLTQGYPQVFSVSMTDQGRIVLDEDLRKRASFITQGPVTLTRVEADTIDIQFPETKRSEVRASLPDPKRSILRNLTGHYSVAIDIAAFNALAADEQEEFYKLFEAYQAGEQVKFIFNADSPKERMRMPQALKEFDQRYSNVRVISMPSDKLSFNDEGRRVISVSREGIKPVYSQFVEDKKPASGLLKVHYGLGKNRRGLLAAALLLYETQEPENWKLAVGGFLTEIPELFSSAIADFLASYVAVGTAA